MSALDDYINNEYIPNRLGAPINAKEDAKMNDSNSANRRYYWLKLQNDFFRQKEIKKLRRIPGGDTYTIIYLKMLLRSAKDGGKLFYDGVEDDFASELAYDIDEDVEAVKVTVQFLMANHILFQNTVDEYELITAQEMMGSETDSTRRSRKSRAKAKMIAENNELKLLQCNGDAT